MSDRPTPETDKEAWEDRDGLEVVGANFARGLENERDAAVEALKDLVGATKHLKPCEATMGKANAVLREIEGES